MKRELHLKRGEYLSNILPELPYGIIDKTYTGIGGTYSELTSKRNSIIVAPLKSIANCKKAKHPDLIVVNGDRDQYTIANQIVKAKNTQKPIKLMSTPESVWKALCAIQEAGLRREDFFYLIDELHMYQTESGYRLNMGRAIEEYFKHPHKQRALMTATWIESVDEMFSREPITKIVSEIAKKQIQLFDTDNLYEAIAQSWNGEKFIFINSIEGAKKIEKLLGFSCNIYCSDSKESKAAADKSFRKFNDPLSDVNIFTSAYFMGYDIDFSGDIIIGANGYLEHTMIDSRTVYHISGRIRGNIRKIKMIAVTKKNDMEIMTKEGLLIKLLEIAGNQTGAWTSLLQNGLITDENKLVWETFLNNSGKYKIRLTRKRNDSEVAEIDYHAIDGVLQKFENYQHYSDVKNLISGINNCEQLNCEYGGKITTAGPSDKDLKFVKDLRKLPRLKAFEKFVSRVTDHDPTKAINLMVDCEIEDHLHSDYDYEVFLAQHFQICGLDSLLKTGGDKRKLMQGINKAKEEKMAREGYVIFKIKKTFPEKGWISQNDAKKLMQSIFDECEIKRKAKGTTLEEYYDLKESPRRINGKKTRGFEILRMRA